LLALVLGHLWDLVQVYVLRQRPSEDRPKKKIYRFGELVEASSAWSKYYPKSRLRWLAKTQIWVGVLLTFTLLYGLRALLSSGEATEISN
jgi:hypothetical protein